MAEKKDQQSLCRLLMFWVLNAISLHCLLWAVLPVLNSNHEFQSLLAKMASWLVNYCSVKCSAHGDAVMLQNATMQVSYECTAVNISIVLVSFILAYPSSIRLKAVGVISGVFFVQIINLLRISGIGILLQYQPSLAQNLHDYVWEVIFLLAIIALSYLWGQVVMYSEKSKPHSP